MRVVELEGHRRGGIFGRPASGPGRMQWTVEQETSRIFAPDNPFAQMTTDGVRAVPFTTYKQIIPRRCTRGKKKWTVELRAL